jgi:hypothetical protein
MGQQMLSFQITAQQIQSQFQWIFSTTVALIFPAGQQKPAADLHLTSKHILNAVNIVTGYIPVSAVEQCR